MLSEPEPGVSFFAVEALATALALAAALLFPAGVTVLFSRPVRLLGNFARRRGLAVAAVAVGAVVTRLAILPVSPPPQPSAHDEFSYLLAADTFASGRLANPTHPQWRHFETFHVDMRPTYASMYFPAQGLVMALGKVLFGDPWVGVLLTAGLMCGAICWMLQGWMPPGWALLGGALAVLRLGVFSYWVDSYFGGAIPALGGALVLGALPRLLRKPAVAAGFAMAAGSGILANSRAYEGFLLCAPMAVVLALAIVRSGRATQHLSAMAAPAGLLAACLVFLGYYNFRAFGDPLTLPYKLNRAEYAAVPVFLWQKPYPVPQYRHPVMRDFYLKWERRVFVQARSFPGLLAAIAQKIAGGTLFFIGLALMPLLVFLPRALSDRRVRPAVLLVVIGAVGIAPNPWFMPHYFAPYTGAIYLLLLQAMRHMRYWQPSGKALVHITPFLCLALFFLRLFAAPLHLGMSRYPMAWFGSEPVGLERASVARHLAALPGKQLALVRYEPRHITFDEWVYNAADIDGAKVVWARETDDSSDRELLNYFTERQAWLVEPDFTPPRITPLRR